MLDRIRGTITRLALALLLVVGVTGVPALASGLDEDFEDFQPGPIDGVQGWQSPVGAQIVETGLPGLGDRSVQALGLNAGTWLWTPPLGGAYGTLAMDLRINSPVNGIQAGYSINFNNGSYPVASFLFSQDDLVLVRDSVGSCLTNYTLTGGTWSSGRTIAVRIDFAPDPVSVVTLMDLWLDGVLVYEGYAGLGCGFPSTPRQMSLGVTGPFTVDAIADNIRFEPVYIADINRDGAVDVLDLLAVLGDWGTCSQFGCFQTDINVDGIVDVLDLLIVLAQWG